ncbi:hypothetical protein SAMN05445504_9288 [Burkholderia sp. CF099]|nr:hypothetical protein SAMN05445504_9288 [Burkholderia sp. CF099]
MKYQRGKNLSELDVAAIVGILDEWSGKLTWSLLCTAISRRLRQKYTRQALHAHEPIRAAFGRRKGALPDAAPTRNCPVVSAEEVHRLREQNERLQKQLDAFRDKFVVWAYNAHAKGLTEADLQRPLPRVDRDRTDELKARRKG